MRFLKTVSVVILFSWLQACSPNNANPAPEPGISTPVAEVKSAASAKQLPPFLVQDATGKTVDLQSFKGKKLFVNLWATWCPPCRAEMPSIEKLTRSVNNDNVQFVLLSLDNDFESAKKYVHDNKLNLPIFFPAADLPELFTVTGIPTTFIFDESGTLIAQRDGMENYNTDTYRKLFGSTRN